MSVRLIALSCPACQTPLEAAPGAFVFLCACGQGVVLGREGLIPIEAISQRPAASSPTDCILGWEVMARVDSPMPRRFVIPAVPMSLDQLAARAAQSGQQLDPTWKAAGWRGSGYLAQDEAVAIARWLAFRERVMQPDLLTRLEQRFEAVTVRLIALAL
jgi:hypothetical protein